MRTDLRGKLIAIKVLHTAVWVFFVSCIVLIPLASMLHKFRWAEVMAGCMFVECGVLAWNRGRCPLTKIASRYTDDRSTNFDIYLPRWLAEHNKLVFGSLFCADMVLLIWQFG